MIMTRGANNRYSRQFREQAMDLVRVQGLQPMPAARELGIPFSTLLVWLKKAGWVRREEPKAALSEDPMALKIRVAELERQVKRLEMEKDILKKATAFFASQDR
jgi:transposase